MLLSRSIPWSHRIARHALVVYSGADGVVADVVLADACVVYAMAPSGPTGCAAVAHWLNKG